MKKLALCILISAMILSGCSDKAATAPDESCHGFKAPWKKPTVCRASIYTTDSSGIFLAHQGIQEIELNDQVILLVPTDALFEPNSADFSDTAEPILFHLAKYLKNYSEDRISVTGNTDPIGSYHYKKKLSTQQATAVVGYLWGHGVIANPATDRVVFSGKGSTKPIATNRKVRGMALNRRIEIIIDGKYKPKSEPSSKAALFLKNKKSYHK